MGEVAFLLRSVPAQHPAAPAHLPQQRVALGHALGGVTLALLGKAGLGNRRGGRRLVHLLLQVPQPRRGPFAPRRQAAHAVHQVLQVLLHVGRDRLVAFQHLGGLVLQRPHLRGQLALERLVRFHRALQHCPALALQLVRRDGLTTATTKGNNGG